MEFLYTPNSILKSDEFYYYNLLILNSRFDTGINNNFPNNFSNIILKNNYFKKNIVDEAWFFYTSKSFYNMDIISQNSAILSKNLEKIKVISSF